MRWLLRADSVKFTLVFLTAMRHGGLLWRMYNAPADTVLGELLIDRPEIYGMVITPFVNSIWNARTRLQRVIDHCVVATRIGGPLRLRHDDYYVVTTLPWIGADHRVTLDSPRWLIREGLMCLSLWEKDNRIFSISFTLADQDGRLRAYVGGLQGSSIDGIARTYHDFTKAAFGIRPRDMIITLFGMFCRAIGVEEIHAVSDANRHQLSNYSLARAKGVDPVEQKYDNVWLERGGALGTDGFFRLPLSWHRRTSDEIPANKRAQYRRRYAMLDELEADIVTAFAPDRVWRREHFA